MKLEKKLLIPMFQVQAMLVGTGGIYHSARQLARKMLDTSMKFQEGKESLNILGI